jgi:hypothetical protein
VGYNSEAGETGVVLEDGVFTLVQYEDAFLTRLEDLNDAGQAVGWALGTRFVPGEGTITWSHGFVWEAGAFTLFDVPGAYQTQLTGINNRGQLAGTYRDGTGAHGFLATPVPEPPTWLLWGSGLLLAGAARSLRSEQRERRL